MAAITDLTTLAGSDVADGDYLPIHDVSAATDKKVTASALFYERTARAIVPTVESVANNGTITLTGIVYGLLLVNNHSEGGQALIWLSAASTSIIAQVGTNIGVTAGAASKVNVYISGGNCVIENKRGLTISIGYLALAS